jgi:hypothetical protein
LAVAKFLPVFCFCKSKIGEDPADNEEAYRKNRRIEIKLTSR